MLLTMGCFFFFGFRGVQVFSFMSFVGFEFYFAFLFRSKKKRSQRKCFYVEVIPQTKWLKMTPSALKRPNSQVCQDFLTEGVLVDEGRRFLTFDGFLAQTVYVS